MKMKMKLTLKRILTSVLAGVMLLGAIFMTSGCKEKKPQGEICKLTTAYNNGYITRNDLLSIAYYHKDKILNPEIDENFQPIERGELDEETRLKIQESFAYCYRHVEDYHPSMKEDFFKIELEWHKNTKASDIEFSYYGCYNGSYVINHYSMYLGVFPVYSEWSIDGVKFSQTSSNDEMYIWRATEE